MTEPSAEPDTWSPQAADATAEVPECARMDAALERVAGALAARVAAGEPAFDAFELDARLRAEGAPYVWPHSFALASATLTEPLVRHRLAAWLSSFEGAGERRCGVAERSRAGRTAFAAVAADALADLEPLPARVRPMSYVDVRATMLVPFSGAKVVLLGPRGAPRPLLTEVHGSHIFARFPVDAPGRWLVQVLSEVATGPRPVLEAWLIAGAGERRAFAEPAPAEALVRAAPSAADELLALLNAERRSERLQPLRPDSGLTRLAREHAELMQKLRRGGHDLGDGPPDQRVANEQLPISDVGENYCRAPSARLAHRGLWFSPSHRANILSPHFDSIGIGVASDLDGSVWVSELFGRRAD